MPLGDAELRPHPEQNGGRNAGVFSRAGVLQKHFRRDELLGAVVAAGLQVDGIVRSCPFSRLGRLRTAVDQVTYGTAVAVLNKRCVQMQEKVEYPWWTEVKSARFLIHVESF